MTQRQRIRHGGTDQWIYVSGPSAFQVLDNHSVVELMDLGGRSGYAFNQSSVIILTDLAVEITGDELETINHLACHADSQAWTVDERYVVDGERRLKWKPRYSPIRMLNDPYIGGVLGMSGELFAEFIGDISTSPLSREGLSPVLLATLWLWDRSVVVAKLDRVSLLRSEELIKVPLHRWHGAVSRLLTLRKIEHRRVNRLGDPRIELLTSNAGDVSVIIPTNGARRRVWGEVTPLIVRCVESVFSQSSHEDLEVIVVYDTQTPLDVLDALTTMADRRLRLVEFMQPFNFSEKCNLGAVHAQADTLCFLNDDTVVQSVDWIESSVGYLERPDVALVGPRLLLEDSRIQSAGHVIIDEGAVHLAAGESSLKPATQAARLSGERIGVTFACAFTTSQAFRRVGGLCEQLPNSFNDVDFAFKLRFAGLRSVWNADVDMTHFESLTRNPRPHRDEVEFINNRWGHHLEAEDPYIEPPNTPAWAVDPAC